MSEGVIYGLAVLVVVILFTLLLKRQRALLNKIPVSLCASLLICLLIAPVFVALIFERPVTHTLLTCLWLIIGAGCGEEIFYRGYIQSRINETFGRPFRLSQVQFGFGLFMSAFLFGFLHTLNSVDYFQHRFTFAWGFGRYKFQHEPIFYAHVNGESDAWYGDKSQSTLWQEKKPAANRIHPTAKPVELVERALINSSKADDIVVDLFGGSGSTLIGCERRGRKARLMEIDPKYADCIVRRWQEYTGEQALLEGDGRTYEEIVVARAGASV